MHIFNHEREILHKLSRWQEICLKNKKNCLENKTYKIIGVKDEYLSMTEVILPSVYQGKNVSAIGKDAFNRCTNLERIHIGKTYKSIEKATFNGCINLSGIYLYELDGNTVSPDPTGLLEGCNNAVTIFIPEGANYFGGYTWSYYADKMETFVLGGEQ